MKSRTKVSKLLTSKSNSYYPPVGFFFDVRIADKPDTSIAKQKVGLDTLVLDGSFQDISGISVEIPTEEIQEGGENRYIYRVPLPAKYTNLVLKRGLVVKNSRLGEWCKSIFESSMSTGVQPKNLIISLLDEERFPIMVWSVIDAYPVKWSIGGLNAMNNEIVIESIEMVYKRFEILM